MGKKLSGDRSPRADSAAKRKPKKTAKKPRARKSDLIKGKLAENSDKTAARDRSLKAIEPFRFQPGKSGNPGGRPKRDFAAEIAQAVFEQNPDVVYKAMLKSMKRGSAGTFAVLAERGYGKSLQPIEMSGDLTGTVKVEFIHVAALQEP